MTPSDSHAFDLCREAFNHGIDVDATQAKDKRSLINIADNVNEIQTQKAQETEQMIEIDEHSNSNPSKLQQNYYYVVTRYYR